MTWRPPPAIDPVEFRLRYLTGDNNKRVAEVLRAAAMKAGWRRARRGPVRRSGAARARNIATGRGVAISGMAGTVVAQIADVEVDTSTGKVTGQKVTVAHDCGIIVNPDGLRNQIEGNVIQGSSRALMEEVNFDSAGVKNLNWNTYPIIRFREVPEVDIVLIDQREMPPHGRRRSIIDRHRARRSATRSSTRSACGCGRCRSRRTGSGVNWKS